MTASSYILYTEAMEEELARFDTIAIWWTGWFGSGAISWGLVFLENFCPDSLRAGVKGCG
jgi:hypothetical protein